jgi:hypothetical protein
MPAGSTIEVDKAPEGDEKEVKITIVKPKVREAVGVGAKGGDGEGEPSGEGSPSSELPENPEVLPEVPDAPPADGSASDES